MGSWQKVKIGDFLRRVKRPIKLEEDKKYKLVTIKIHHNGVTLREEKEGKLIKSSMYEVKSGDFILSGIDARNGAFGIIPDNLDKAIVTNDFWYFEVDENIINKYFFLELTATSWFDDICKKGSDGTTQRIRLQKNKFFNQEILLPPLEKQIKLITTFQQQKTKSDKLLTEISTQQTLLKQLKQTILQEAIEGKLTKEFRKNNPHVEPAKELLKKIKAEKEKLIKEKKIKAQKPLPPIKDDEIPFEIPENWEWCRLGEIFQTTSGSTPDRGNPKYWNGKISWLKSGELNDSLIVEQSEEKITNLGLLESSATLFTEDTILIAMYGATAGKLGLLTFPSTTNQAICGFYKNNYIEKWLLFYFLQSQRRKIINDSWGQSQPNISQAYLKNIIFPLPPSSEQKEIVATIEKLFTICDELESQINQNKTTVDNLMATVLKEAFQEKQ